MFINKKEKPVKREMASVSKDRKENYEIPEAYQSKSLDNITESVGAEAIRISPIVFTGMGNNKNYGLYDLPLQISQAINFKISGDRNRIDPLNDRELCKLDYEAREVSIDEATNYIIQNSFMSFCCLVDQCDLSVDTDILTYLPIKQMVYEELTNKIVDIKTNIGFMTSQFAASNENNFDGSFEEKQEAALNCAIACALNVRDIILQYVVDAICIGSDKAINDILMQVHVVPNIDDIYLSISRAFPSVNDFRDNPSMIPSVCTIAIKSYMRNQIITLIGRNLIPSIEELITKLFYVQANIYDDFHYFSINEIKNTVNNEKASHHKSNHRIPDSIPIPIAPYSYVPAETMPRPINEFHDLDDEE